MTATGPLDRLMALLAPDAIGVPTSPEASTRIVAVGWATVELERATAEVAAALGIAPVAFAPAHESSVLGAQCLVAAGVLPAGVSLAILEPATEGRLAATLARFGEGPAAIWLAWPATSLRVNARGAPSTDRVASDLVALSFSAAGDGPFGPERLVPGGPAHGPHRLRIQPAGTIPA